MSFEQVLKSSNAFTTNQPAEHVSSKYTYLSSAKVVESIMSRGWEPTSVLKKRPITKNSAYSKHGVIFRHPTIELKLSTTDILKPQIYFVNSHAADCAFRFYLGYFRLICGNGLVISMPFETTGTKTQYFRLSHVQFNDFSFIENTMNQMMDNFNASTNLIKNLNEVELKPSEIELLAKKSFLRRNQINEQHFVKYLNQILPASVDAINAYKFDEDSSSTAWAVYNRIQRNLIKGFDAPNPLKNQSVTQYRPIKNFERDINLNVKLFSDVLDLAPSLQY